MPSFNAEVYHNEYLPVGGGSVNAVVTVTSHAAGAPGRAGTEAVEVILLDCSGSMARPRTKLRQARQATEAAIDCLRDGVLFAVVRGSHVADVVYPPRGDPTAALAVAGPETRREATAALAGLEASGGTAIGQWLLAAHDLFAGHPDAIHHAILLTDGKNEHEDRTDFVAALDACRGVFQCDCRGVGTDWEVAELRAVATALLGSVDIIPDPSGMVADFQAMTEAAMGRVVDDVTLRVWVPQAASVAFVKQVSPTILDLTDRASPVSALTVEYPTGAWGDETRDYHLCIDVPPQQVGAEMLAARVGLVVGGERASEALVKVTWTDDITRSTRINRQVAHYTGQAELAQVIQDGLEARRVGDDRTATIKLGRAVQLAAATGNTATAELLARVVDVVDPMTGKIQLRPSVDDADEMALDTRSTKTIRAQQ